MHAEFSERASEAHQVDAADALLGEDEHAVLGVCQADRLDRLRRERSCEVDAGDLGAQKDAESPDAKRGWMLRSCCWIRCHGSRLVR